MAELTSVMEENRCPPKHDTMKSQNSGGKRIEVPREGEKKNGRNASKL